MALSLRFLACVFAALIFVPSGVSAQTLTASNVEIQWRVEDRFRFFRDPAVFKMHETAWRQYQIHVANQPVGEGEKAKLTAQTSVIGTEHMLNDRFIPFSRHLRTKYDWRGWAAQAVDKTCWNEKEQAHSACGGVDAYLNPAFHEVTLSLKPLQPGLLLQEANCEWRVDGGAPNVVPCDEPTSARIPYPAGATVSVNVPGEQPVLVRIKVRDLLIAGLGDSFASGEGNPDMPVVLTGDRRARNLYPVRRTQDASGNPRWLDERCHRSLYGHQLRTALQIAVENPKASVTFLGYACSGASIEDGILGPQSYVGYISDSQGNGEPTIRGTSGGKRDAQLYRFIADLCREKPERDGGIWQCPDGKFRRSVDFVLVSAGGNDIGFSSLVAWATLRSNMSSIIAKWFGATVSARQFGENMQNILPDAYAQLAKALETSVPLKAGEIPFDASHVVLTAYPDILANEEGKVCEGAKEDDGDEARYAANQSLDVFSSWLLVTEKRLTSAHSQLAQLHARMGALAEDHGWTFAGRSYEDRPFRGHGFCAVDAERRHDPAEMLRIPCWSRPDSTSLVCESNFSGGDRVWLPYDPASQHFPYALRQRWVRTFNDVYMTVNEKVLTKDGRIDERASAAVFSETTGAMHPSAEGHAAMADAILMDLRGAVSKTIEED